MKKTNKEIEPVVTENELVELNDTSVLDSELTELNDTDELDLELDEVEEIEPVVTENVKKEKFLNPFKVGVTYVEFQKALGKKTVAEYCKGKLTNEEINWLENELSILKIK